MTTPLAIPSGYAFVMTHDGVGVLAKNSLFNPAEKLSIEADNSTAEFMQLVQDNIDAGFWASALFYLKECWHKKYNSGDDETLEQLKSIMMVVYTAMGRSVYAERLSFETSWL